MIRKLIILIVFNIAFQKLWAQLTVPWSNSLNINFGKGTTNPGPPLAKGKSDFIYTVNLCPDKGYYTIVNSNNCNYTFLNGLNRDAGISYFGPFQYALPETDNGGYMMIVNAGISSQPQVVFEDTVKNLCSNNGYLFWTAISSLISRSSTCNNQNFTLSVESLSGTVIKSWSSGNFAKDTTVFATPNWISVPANDYAFYFNHVTSYNQPPPKSSFPYFYGFFFTLPTGVNDIVVKISLDPSSAYKDCSFPFAIDNIIIMPVTSQIEISDNVTIANWKFGSCFDGSSPLTLYGNISYDPVVFGKTQYAGTPYTNPVFQWQQSLDDGYTWKDIPGENNLDLKHTFPNPDTFLVRLRGADANNFNNLNCNVVSNVIKVEVDSTPKDHSFTSNSPVCEDSDIVFEISGGTSYLTWGPSGFNDNSAYPHVYHPALADSGWYYTKVITFGGCSILDSILVKVIGPDIKVGLSDSLCYGSSFQLSSSGGTRYLWAPASGLSNSNIANPVASPLTTTRYTVKVTDASGCSAFGNQTVYVHGGLLQAKIIAPKYVCPNDVVEIKDSSIGNIVSWKWDLGNGKFSSQQNPPTQSYPADNNETAYRILLTVTDSAGCTNSKYTVVNAEANCYIRVPTAFTPNGDGVNDYLYPLNAFKATNLIFRVYNRLGQLMFETKDWTRKWNGTVNNVPQSAGAYIWLLEYNDATNKRVSLRGTTVLLR